MGLDQLEPSVKECVQFFCDLADNVPSQFVKPAYSPTDEWVVSCVRPFLADPSRRADFIEAIRFLLEEAPDMPGSALAAQAARSCEIYELCYALWDYLAWASRRRRYNAGQMEVFAYTLIKFMDDGERALGRPIHGPPR